jgi:hypothetical protein
MKNSKILILLMMVTFIFIGCMDKLNVPTGVKFNLETLKRIGERGDN